MKPKSGLEAFMPSRQVMDRAWGSTGGTGWIVFNGTFNTDMLYHICRWRPTRLWHNTICNYLMCNQKVTSSQPRLPQDITIYLILANIKTRQLRRFHTYKQINHYWLKANKLQTNLHVGLLQLFNPNKKFSAKTNISRNVLSSLPVLGHQDTAALHTVETAWPSACSRRHGSSF